MWQLLSNYLKTLLVANTDIQEVFDYEVNDFNGQPAAVIVASDNESAFVTTAHNERVYAFSLFLFVARGESGFTDKKCDDVLRQLVDGAMDDLDKNWQVSGISLPTGYEMLFMEAAPSVWGYSNREMLYRMAEIKIRIHTYINTELIT